MNPKLGLVVIGLLSINNALGLATDDLFELSLEELVNVRVTATSTFIESEHASSSSVSVIQRQDWLRRGDQTTIAALSHTTNAMKLPSPFGYVLQVRGYSTRPSSRGSATLIDNVPINSLQYGTSAYSVNNLQLGILDRIEVVRGPGSALHGTDAFHSTVAYQTFSANKPLADMAIEAGEESFYQANLRYSQPLNDSFMANIAIAGSKQGDQELRQREVGPLSGEASPFELTDYSTLLKIHNQGSSDDWQLLASLLYNHEDHPALLGSRQDTSNPDLGPANLSGQKTDSTIYKVMASRELTNTLQLSIDAYYRQMDSDLYVNSISGGDVYSTAIDLDETKRGVNIQLQQHIQRWNSQWALTIGRSEHNVNRFDQTTYNAISGQIISPKEDARHAGFSEQNIDHLAFEAKSYLFDEALTLTYGARIDDYPDFGRQLSPRFSAVYELDHHTAVKMIYGNAFRAPIVGEKVGFRHVSGNPSIDPEEIDSYELVYARKSSHWSQEWLVYQSYLKKGISIVPDASQSLPKTHIYENSSEQEARGVEARINYINRQWSIKANFAYIESYNNTLDIPHTSYPKWITNIDIAYQWAKSTNIALSNQLFGGHYLGDETTANGQELEKGNTYIRSDIRVSQDLNKQLQAWLSVKNIFDKNNRLPSVINIQDGVEDINRTLVIGASYRF